MAPPVQAKLLQTFKQTNKLTKKRPTKKIYLTTVSGSAPQSPAHPVPAQLSRDLLRAQRQGGAAQTHRSVSQSVPESIGQSDIHIVRQSDSQIVRQSDSHKVRQSDSQIVRQVNSQFFRQSLNQIGTQLVRQSDCWTFGYIEIHRTSENQTVRFSDSPSVRQSYNRGKKIVGQSENCQEGPAQTNGGCTHYQFFQNVP